MCICGIANGKELLLFFHSHYTVSPVPNQIFFSIQSFLHINNQSRGVTRLERSFVICNIMGRERERCIPEFCWSIHQASFLLQAMRLTS